MKSGAHCEQCGSREKLLLCSRCRIVYYCCKDHQIKDWKNHKKVCVSQSVNNNINNNQFQKLANNSKKDNPTNELANFSLADVNSVLLNSTSHLNNKTSKSQKKPSDLECKEQIKGDSYKTLSSETSSKQFNDMSVLDYVNYSTSNLPKGNVPYEQLVDINSRTPLHRTKDEQSITEKLCRNVIQDLNSYGVCVVNNFLGKERGMEILEEVRTMHNKGIFEDGKLVNKRGNEDLNYLKTIRSDQIIWIDGKDDYCKNIGMLINKVDKIITLSNQMDPEGELGKLCLKGRTKAMAACYPGDGAHYVKHVDNPNGDGRCITAIYYLNQEWDTKKDGGLLRIFPQDWDGQVADIEPLFDRILFFWSDRRNPHEVQPSFRTRYVQVTNHYDNSVSVYYYRDPSYGSK